MLGEPLSMLVPQVVGFRLSGALREGATATDLVLTVTEMLRKTGVVGKFVEYFGEGLAGAAARRPRDAREHVARVRRDVRLLPGRRADARLPAADRPQPRADRARRGVLQGEPALARPERRTPTYSQVVELDLGDVEPSLAGPAPAAGPRAARAREGGVPRGARHVRRRLRERLARRGRRRDLPGVATRRPSRQPGGAARARAEPRRRGRRAARATPRARRRSTARSSSSTTAPS